MTFETRKGHFFAPTTVHSAASAEPLVERPAGDIAKRGLDLLLVLVFLPLLVPLLLGVAALVCMTSSGPVLFGHVRVGRGGKKFRCWKFRTMVVDGDRILEEHFRRFPEERTIWEEERKLHDDPRVTPLGAVLRKLSLDELPQLINVLVGEMSLVGPRPVVDEEMRKYGRSGRHYLRVRPGVTGLWQISGRSDTGYAMRVLLDRHYVMSWNVLLDIKVLVLTIPAVLFASGAR
ncbi:sugar transferase [Thioclava sp. JE_KL1]|uniref:sugar transferase n=1 Tax=Thioclava sp. JE_KL1 TaxID=2651187 RepID=UPI00128E6A14|nr:sugar transferase [Thioclava sp. JE_KL1]MPQ93028.1 sugar transferase [Thioclava sp. JE_KL1]